MEQLDTFLASTWEEYQGPLPPRFAAEAAAYYGEALARAHGGKWLDLEEPEMPGLVFILPDEGHAHPLAARPPF